MKTEEQFVMVDPCSGGQVCRWVTLEFVSVTEKEQEERQFIRPSILRVKYLEGTVAEEKSVLTLHPDKIKQLRDWCDRCLAI